MAKLIQILVAFLVFLAGILVGFNTIESRYREMTQTEQLSPEDFYQKMVEDKNSIVLQNFPTQLKDVHYAQAGNLIFTNGVDSLYFIRKDVISNYLSYTLRDNHNNVWNLFQEDGEFLLYKVQGKFKEKIIKFRI